MINSTYLEDFWYGLYKDRNPMIVTPLVLFSVHQFVYYTRFLPFFICDRIPALRKYKIQPKHITSKEEYRKCIKHLLLSQVFIQFPLQVFFEPAAKYFGMRNSGSFPTITEIFTQVLFFLVFEDAWEYWFHRFLHHPWFYKHIHKMHHEFTAPFGLTAEYAHPLETLILGMGTIGGPLVYVSYTRDLHVLTVLVWLVVRLFQTVDAHSGYDFPFSLHNFLPFWAGADFHDHHHMAFLGNYGSSFRLWDWICGTDKRYNRYKMAKAKHQKLAEDSIQDKTYEELAKEE